MKSCNFITIMLNKFNSSRSASRWLLYAVIVGLSLGLMAKAHAGGISPAHIGRLPMILVHAIECINDDSGSKSASAKKGQTIKRLQPSRSPLRSIGASSGPSRISMSFADVDVRDVLGQVSEYSGVDIILTPGATGKVTISLRNRPANESIRLIAAAAGLGVALSDGTFIVGPMLELQRAAAEVGNSEFVALKYVSPLEAMGAANRLTPRVRTEEAKGGVIISGLAQDLQAARIALLQIDVQPVIKPETSVFNIQSKDPADVDRMVHEAFPELKVNRQGRTLLLSGAPADLLAAGHAIQTIDVAPMKEAEPEQVLVYRLKFLNPKSAEEALNKVLPKDAVKITVAPEPNAPPAANFSPLSSSFGGGGASGGAGGLGSGSSGGGSGGMAGGAGGQTQSAGGANGSGAPAQPFSRSTRLIIVGARSNVDMARMLLEETDVAQPMVRIQAVMLEVNRDAVKELGINWDINNFGTSFTLPGGSGLNFSTPTRSAASFAVSLQALLTSNKARILAKPNISVADNEDASIFIGDLRRFPGTTIVTPNSGTIQATDALPVGIALLVRPRVHPDGQVTLKVHPVVSTVTSVVDGLPQTASREADTTVRLKEGEELVIGGLDRTDVLKSESRVPILSDIPLVGELFKTRRKERIESEIMVIIRAYPVLTDNAPVHDFRKGTGDK